MERVGKYRKPNGGQALIHVAIECALRSGNPMMLDQLLEIKLYMYEADEHGRTCLYQCFDESASIENCAKVFEIVV